MHFERDNFMTADEAKKFGLIDSVVEKENKSQYIEPCTTSTCLRHFRVLY